MATYWYANSIFNAFGTNTGGSAPNIDFISDTIKIMLTTSSYTPNYATHDYKDDVTNEVSGTGYSAGGATLGTKALTVTAANSFATTWATATAFTAGKIVRPTSGNTYLYRCSVAGTSHASTEPTWPTTVGATVTDNGITWTNVGSSIMQIDAADPSWSSSTITARYAVIYDATPGSDATRPLICAIDFGSDVSTTNGTFAITFDAQGIIYLTF